VTSPSVPRLPGLFSRGLEPFPLAPLQWWLARVLQSVVARHPGLFERLGSHAQKRFGIEPTDLPFVFVIEPRPQAPRTSVLRTLPHNISVRIAGPLLGLLGLIDGSYDGDALFFSRDLIVEGDVEAVLALRNALEDAEVDLIAEAAAVVGPLAPVAQRMLRGALSRLPQIADAFANAGARRWS
jgi:O2-independent ubiquinone biosynthesis accessory factor UbiT